jgi:hypothetical protein
LSATLAEQEPRLTPPPRPNKPPESSAEDRHLALIWIMGGAASADVAAHFARIDERLGRELEADGWTLQEGHAA